jgi:orotate phosphoribosyltransferase
MLTKNKNNKFIYKNEQILNHHEALISIDERGFLFGDGLFETCRFINKKIINFEAHLARIKIGLLNLKFNVDLQNLETKCYNLLKKNNLQVDTFYGVPEGATKLGIITQYKYAKQSPSFSKGSHVLAMGRAKPKDHGAPKDKFFVGAPTGKVVVIEDVTTTGGSLITTLDGLKEAGINVVGVISLTNRMEKITIKHSARESNLAIIVAQLPKNLA